MIEIQATMRTFEGWKVLGYFVNKGARAVWVNGIPMFTQYQVTYKHRKERKHIS